MMSGLFKASGVSKATKVLALAVGMTAVFAAAPSTAGAEDRLAERRAARDAARAEARERIERREERERRERRDRERHHDRRHHHGHHGGRHHDHDDDVKVEINLVGHPHYEHRYEERRTRV